MLFVVGWFISGSDTPDYSAADQEWTNWADDNELKSRVGALLILIAGFVFLHFAGMIRSVLGSAETRVRGSVQLARVAFAGALTGITGITMAVIMIAGATAVGGSANPMVSKSGGHGDGGALPGRRDGLCRVTSSCWTVDTAQRCIRAGVGIVALLGALAFFVTFFTLIVGPDKDSVFGYGFFVGFLALAIWAIATSIAQYRGVRPMPASRRRQRPTSMMLILQTPPLENHRP